ncbi:MAG: ABC transporter permease [Flavobacteriales bacterium]|nr:ABC transporter permease [Flavobacteriales bacterium]
MLRNYLLIALRNLARNKVFAAINVLGLAIGLAAFTLIGAYVQDEKSFDTFEPRYESIYRVVGDLKLDGQGERSSSCVFGLGPTLLHDHPELIGTYARFFDFQEPTLAFRVDDKHYNEPDVYLADSTVFDLFGYRLEEGDPASALAAPNSIVVTREMARRYFGDADPMGRSITWDKQVDLQVTGVLAPTPRNSHIRFDALVSIYTILQKWQHIETHNWVWNPCWTYVRLKEGVSAAEVEHIFPDFIHKYYPDFLKEQVHHHLQPLAAIHLTSDLDYEMAPNGDKAIVNALWAIGIFILIIACVNYMNLATAQSASRAREIGVRRTAGADRMQLIGQFLLESQLIAWLAAGVSLGLIALSLNTFNSIADEQLTINAALIGRLCGFAVLAGLLAGSYPAFFLSSLEPTWVMKGQGAGPGQGRTLRKALVVGQFAVALGLIIATVFVRRQARELQEADLGFDQEHVLVVRVRPSMHDFVGAFMNELHNMSGVTAVSYANDIIGRSHNTHELNYDGMPADQWKYFPALITDPGMQDVLHLDVVAGRWFSRDAVHDDSLSVVINERMVKELGWGAPEQALGRRLNTPSGAEHVVGVVKDFHFDPLFKPVGPFFFDMASRDQHTLWFRCVYARLVPGDPKPVIDAIGRKWNGLTQDFPFEYEFLDNDLDAQYRAQNTLATLVTFFALFAVVIACLGLYALAAFSTEKRSREIGIRKVLGASGLTITGLVTREFLVLVLLANVIAWPLTLYAVHRWLEGFAVRTAIDPFVFIGAAVVVLVIAAFTVAYHATQAAWQDPMRALRADRGFPIE